MESTTGDLSVYPMCVIFLLPMLGRGLESLLTSLNSAHSGSDLALMGLDNHPTEMQWDRVFYLAGQLNI